MRLHHLILATVVIAAGFGIGFIALPAVLWALYGVQLSPEGLFVARLFGAANVGVGLVLWFLRNVGHEAEQAAARGILCWCVLETLVLLAGQLAGTTNALGWSLVGFDVLLAVAYGYFLFTPARQRIAGSPT